MPVSRTMTWTRWVVLAAVRCTGRRPRDAALPRTTASTWWRPRRPTWRRMAPTRLACARFRVTDPNRPDILKTEPGGPTARYDRTLTLEVWYPAALAGTERAGGEYRALTRDPASPSLCAAAPVAMPRRSPPVRRSRS